MTSHQSIALILVLAAGLMSCETPPTGGLDPDVEITSSEDESRPNATADEPIGNKLKWPPPSYNTTLIVDPNNIPEYYSLDTNKDYKIIMPSTPVTKSINLYGGRNITIIGGASRIATSSYPAAFVFEDKSTNTSNRVIHVEGVHIDMQDYNNGSPSDDADAIVLRSGTARFQFQNIRIINVHGDHEGEHPDAIHHQKGARQLFIYKASITTDFQGFMIPPYSNGKTLGKAHLENIDFSSVSTVNSTNNPIYFWITQGIDDCRSYPKGLYINNVYAQESHYGWGTGESYPNLTNPADCSASLSSGRLIYDEIVTEPGYGFSGNGVAEGSPPNGPFVPSGLAGINYISPGYEAW